MFEKASRLNITYNCSFGVISVNDLWNLSLQTLDTIAKNCRDNVNSFKESESFISEVSSETLKEKEIAELRFDIVRYIIKVKLEEKKQREDELSKQNTKKLLQELLYKKELQNLENLSVEEIQEKINSL